MCHEREPIVRFPRTLGRQARIEHRHVIASLVRKPRAFAGFLYREEQFPGQRSARRMTSWCASAPAKLTGIISPCLRSPAPAVKARPGRGRAQRRRPRPAELERITPELHSYDAPSAEEIAAAAIEVSA